MAALDPCPDQAVPFDQVLEEVGEAVLAHGVRTFDPLCAAHLHCPTLLTAAATELAIGATNQSMDSFDQAPAATLVEDHLVRWLAGVVGLPAGATGVLTSGGTASNLLGLLLAREHEGAAGHPGDASSASASASNGGADDSMSGPNPGTEFDGPGTSSSTSDTSKAAGPTVGGCIVASEAAHFSVQQAAWVLGLGRDAAVPVATDDRGRLDLDALVTVLADLDRAGRRVLAIVGTAGTTDLGAIDPLHAIADVAAERGAWFHVDAAVGAALCLSDRLRPLVRGLGRADSVTADLHKLWWQPIGASALLVRDPGRLGVLRQPSSGGIELRRATGYGASAEADDL